MIKIINETGNSIPTKILDENGNQIKYVTNLSIDFPIDGKVEAKITLMDVLVEVIAEEEYYIMDLSNYPRKYLELLKVELDKVLELYYSE